MKISSVLAATVVGTIASFTLNRPAQADTVQAHCDFYQPGATYASFSTACSFSQRQGFITIQTQNGEVYDFSPVGDVPGNFIDAAGNAVYRQAGLGSDGLIFQLPNETLYVYWDTSAFETSVPYSGGRIGTLNATDPGTQINVRSGPTQYSRAIAYGLVGDSVDILQCVMDSDFAGSDLNWCEVQFLESGAIGWIRSDFIIFPSDGF